MSCTIISKLIIIFRGNDNTYPFIFTMVIKGGYLSIMVSQTDSYHPAIHSFETGIFTITSMLMRLKLLCKGSYECFFFGMNRIFVFLYKSIKII